MHSLKILTASAALAFAVCGAAAAQEAFHGQAKLATPVSAPTQTVVNGVTWSCAGDACTGEAAHFSTLDNPVRGCKRVAEALGPLTAFSARGRALSGGDLKACNTAAVAKASGSAPVAANK
jgi:hypothetical protein